MQQQTEELTPSKVLETLKFGVLPNIQQDFIFLSGRLRVEYHHKDKAFIIEERTFDRVNVTEEEETEQPQLDSEAVREALKLHRRIRKE